MPFVEKYRPKKFEDVVGLDEKIVKLVNKDIPNLLFIGPAGTGKTTVARIVVNKMGGQCLELNASDERGIDTIRNKIKNYVRTQSIDGGLKFVFLDEADGLSRDAQQSLRTMMEKYSGHCRFILTANYINKIIDPLKSRCNVIEFGQPDKQDCKNKLGYILEAEGIAPEQGEDLLSIVEHCYPDIRRMINTLQVSIVDGKLSEAKLIESEGQKVWKLIQDKNFKGIRRILVNGADLNNMIIELEDLIFNAEEKVPKRELMLLLCECNRSMPNVVVQRIEFEDFCLKAIKCIS